MQRPGWAPEGFDPTRPGAGRVRHDQAHSAARTADVDTSRFVQVWSRALHTAGYVPLTPIDRDQILTTLADRLIGALLSDPVDSAVSWQVGADLVAVGFATPEALGRTVTLVNGRLATDVELPDPAAAAARLPALVEALVGGFTAAVHDRALDAQDEVRAAAMIAQARAEEALRESEARLRHLATHDPVTGVPNRVVLTQRIGELVETTAPGARLGLCCLDLDRFAAVNDSLGHQVGDRLLQAVAERLQAVAAPAGWLVTHLDTDQFAILLEQTSSDEQAGKAADKALSVLAEPFLIDDVELPVTASAGVVEGPAAGSPAEWLRAAQTALHWAKADGRAQWRLFSHSRSAADAARYQLSAAIPRAVRQGEFTLHYQPLVDLAGHRLVGVEALARWHHPEHGLLRAGQFIDLAEQTGLIVPLGNQLLAQACRQAAAWEGLSDLPPYLSVNLAPSQLHQPGLVGQIAQALDRTGLPPHRLQLEITEYAAIGSGDLSATLASLVSLGVRIAVDDFGTGYSNLTRLRDLPLHALKLDASLARHFPPQPTSPRNHEGFLATVVALGHTLGLTVIAEGVETVSHADRMRTAGCDTGQGWYLGRPLPADQIRQLVVGAAGPARPW
jgi:diguanylate cyclase (GGDEF)-like protein